MSAEKYISVTEAKACAMSLLPDPILRMAVNTVLDRTPEVEISPIAAGFSERRRCPSCGGEGITELYDLRENLFESDAFMYRVFCLCGRATSWCDTLADADNEWNTRTTNADRLRAMDDAQLADLLHAQTVGADAVWNEEFSRVFCGSCEACGENLDMECPYGRPVDWWLKQEVRDGR